MEKENSGLRLLKKGQNGLRQLIFGRMGIVLVLLIFQFLVLAALLIRFEEYFFHYFSSSAVLAVYMVLHLQNRKMSADTRASWFIIILTFPVFGTLLYLFINFEFGHRMLKKRTEEVMADTKGIIAQDTQTQERFENEDPGAASLCGFVARQNGAVVYENTDVTFIPTGEKKLEYLLQELEKAEKYIYLEYFIVSEGVMWGQILEVLARKAAQGVEVRMIYDGTCEFILLPKGYTQKLKTLGISCKVFSPISAFVSTHYNYRDHRKILVIDGHTAFTGGINLSDEYINIGSRFGHWKDTAVMLKGEAVRGFALMFLQMWNIDERKPDYAALSGQASLQSGSGYVMPFGDCPLDTVKLGRAVYMDMLNRSRSSVRIMTPYLILDDEVENCLCYTAARGVRVQILLPGIPDKYIPYAIAKTHYRTLLDAGVEIYEYTPGFDHGKVVVADCREAVVGTINFDYRSFCHHFECGAYMYGCDCIGDMVQDFDECTALSRQVSYESIKHEKWHRKLVGYVLKGFAPLL